MKIHKERQKKTEDNSEGLRVIAPDSLAKEFKSEICDICDLLQLRHGDEIASDTLKAFFAESTK